MPSLVKSGGAFIVEPAVSDPAQAEIRNGSNHLILYTSITEAARQACVHRPEEQNHHHFEGRWNSKIRELNRWVRTRFLKHLLLCLMGFRRTWGRGPDWSDAIVYILEVQFVRSGRKQYPETHPFAGTQPCSAWAGRACSPEFPQAWCLRHGERPFWVVVAFRNEIDAIGRLEKLSLG